MKFQSLKRTMPSVAILAFTAFGANAEELSLEGKTIGVTVVGTSHHWDLQAFKGQKRFIRRPNGP